jgi:hypothetical protein
MKLFTIICAAALTICGSALAFSPDTITAHFATPVLVGETAFPAGNVIITVARGNNVVLTFRSQSGVTTSVLANRINQFAETDSNTTVVLGRQGNGLKVERIWLDDHSGFALVPNAD